MIVDVILLIMGMYVVAGFCFALAFISRGVDKIDESARGSSIGFRLIILPGTLVFWPLLLAKWLQSSKSKPHD